MFLKNNSFRSMEVSEQRDIVSRHHCTNFKLVKQIYHLEKQLILRVKFCFTQYAVPNVPETKDAQKYIMQIKHPPPHKFRFADSRVNL